MTANGESPYDVAVVGAGPAGSLAALLLARQGRRVLLVDKGAFPRDKTCGCCLNPVGVDLLRKLGLGAALADAVTLNRLLLRLPSRTLEFALPVSLGLPRTMLDTQLVEHAIAAGAHFLPSTAATLQPCSADAPLRTVALRGQVPVASPPAIAVRLVLAADGLRGSTLDVHPQCAWCIAADSWFGVSCTLDRALAEFPASTIAMHVGADGYVGVIRLPDCHTHFAAALSPSVCRTAGGPGAHLGVIFRACGLRKLPDLESATFLGTPLLTRRRPVLGAHRVLALGDAAAYIEPFTGEGMTWALQSAHLLSELLPSSLAEFSPDLPAIWTRRHHALLASHIRLCGLLRYSLHHPRLLASAAGLAGLVPSLGRAIVRRISSPGSLIVAGEAS